jgi:hypothetical protein
MAKHEISMGLRSLCLCMPAMTSLQLWECISLSPSELKGLVHFSFHFLYWTDTDMQALFASDANSGTQQLLSVVAACAVEPQVPGRKSTQGQKSPTYMSRKLLPNRQEEKGKGWSDNVTVFMATITDTATLTIQGLFNTGEVATTCACARRILSLATQCLTPGF